VSESPDQRGAEVLALAQHYSGLAGIPKEEMDALAVQALLKILSVAKQHSPYWNRILKGVRISGTTPQQVLRSLPQLTRSDIQRNWDDMQIRIQGPESDYVILKTSGSTGQPIQISKYRPEYSRLIDAFAVMEFVWFKRKLEWKFGAFRLHVKDSDAIRLGPPIEYLGEAAMAFQRESTQHTPTEFLDALEQHQPDYLLTNPVTLKLVAQEQIKQKRPLKPMQQILTLADRVDDELRELVREVFGAKIVDRYSSVEFNMIAMQCPFENHLHVVAPNVVVEIVRPDGVPCQIGEPGQLLITSLQNFAMPLFRYQQGDIAQWGEPCTHGIHWPVIEQVHGRVRTVETGEDGQPRLITLFGADFMLMKEILDYQVIKFDDAIVFACQTTEGLGEAEQARVIASLHKVLHNQLPVRFMFSEEPVNIGRWKAVELFVVKETLNPEWDLNKIQSFLA
jgi:phenylacetate-CoA ligase